MNKTNWKNWMSEILDCFETLGRTTASFLWTAMLAFCIAATITDAGVPRAFLAVWVLFWVILRVIRHSTVKHEAIFAGAISANSFQSAFTFILDGIISCFTLGQRMAEGGDLISPITRIVLGILWLVLFLTEIFIAVIKNHENAQLAISSLEELSTRLTDEDTKCVSIVAQHNDGPKKVFYWVPAESEPNDSE